ALQVVLAGCVPIAAACIARRVAPEAGWAAAAATALIGGFGWLLARDAVFITSPPSARYGADLVIASPNAVYGLFPPPLPRELGLVLLGTAAVLLALALAGAADSPEEPGGDGGLLVLAGIFLGCAGLVSVPALVAGVAWTVAAVLALRSERAVASLARVLAPALVVFALWAAPVVRGMAEFGGLVNVSPSLGREWPLPTALGSWGLLVPLALLGGLAARSFRNVRVVAAFAVATVVLLALAIARGAFDWALAGNATVLHQGRIWPVAHLLAAALAGVGLWTIGMRLERFRRLTGRAVMGALLVVGAASPALASVALTETMKENEGGYVYEGSDLDEGSFVRRAAARLDPDDIVVVDDASRAANALGFHLFSFSGARLADYDDPRLETNDLRIRFADLAALWEERSAAEAFEPDFELKPLPDASEDADARELTGEFGGRTWRLSPVD
ncbi:MAG: hypothetical protein M3174_01940, partial [Actinomycetota bacterium]|nr:hypothetical protein [Actinomycetota bacterium]